MNMQRFFLTILSLLCITGMKAQTQPSKKASEKAYIFTYFDTKKQAAGLCLAYSYDGYTWTAVNDNKPIMKPQVGKDKLLRDPSIVQAPDGTFHLVWTSSWHDQIIGYASSQDLIHWSEQKAIPVMKDFPTAENSWAPELFYDRKDNTYYIYWASTVPGMKGVKTEGCLSENGSNHRIYCTTTKDFETFTKTKLWYNPDFNAIDAAVVEDPLTGELIMAVKNENLNPPEKNIRIVKGKSMKKGFSKVVSAPIHDKERCEGPAPLFVGDDLLVYYDMYSRHRFGASVSHDHGKTWEDATSKISMPAGMSHGTAIAVDKAVVDRLAKWDEQRHGLKEETMGGYLMVYHKDQDHGLHMAVSEDGYNWQGLNGDRAIIAGDTIAMQKGIRDPHIFRAPNGDFYLAMTDLHVFGKRDGIRDTEWERDGKKYGWGNNKGLVLMKSSDLVHWTRTNLDFTKLGVIDGNDWSEVGCVWAPETVWDYEESRLMVHFTTRFGNGKNVIYYVYMNDDFTEMLSKPKLLFSAPDLKYNVIDSDIIHVGDTYHLFYVSHEAGATPAHAYSSNITGPYTIDQTYYDGEKQGHEAPNCWKRLGQDTYVVMFDNFRRKPMNFGFVETRDFFTYTPIGYFDDKNGKMHRKGFEEQKHGAVIWITKQELEMLKKQFPN